MAEGASRGARVWLRAPLLWGAVTGAAVLALALVADGRLRHGVGVTWRAEHGGRVVAIDRTVEHRTTFPNAHRPLSRYIQAWPFEHWGIPDTLPEIDARVDATLTVPQGSPRILGAASANRTEVLVDGRPAEQGPVGAGDHALTVFWFGAAQAPNSPHWDRLRPVSLELRWGPQGGAMRPVPRNALEPPEGAWPPLRQALWIAAPLLALLFGAGVAWSLFSDGSRRRARITWVATAAVVLLAAGYRLYDYEVMPEFRENADELFATWNGWQLLSDGTTRGWSLWASRYGNRVDHETLPYFRKRPVQVIRPYFEHPPLLHILVGAAAHLGGANHWAHAKLKHTRLVPIGLSLLVVLLIVAVGRRLDATGPAPVLAALLYAALPTIALQGRVIKEEALIGPLILAALLFYLRWRDDGRRHRDLVAAAILTGLCTLTKVPGVVFVPVLVAMITAERRYRDALIAGAIATGVAGLLLVYAAAIDWDLFWFTTSEQASLRATHFNVFPRFFDDPLVNHNMIGRGWLIFLWLAWAATVFRRGERSLTVLALPPIVYLTGMAVSSGNWTYGWYLLPIYPFLCLGAGRFLADLWKEPDLVRGTLFVGLAVMYTLNFTVDEEWARNPSHWEALRSHVTIFCVAALLPFGLAEAFRTRPFRWLARTSTAALLALLVVVGGLFVARYDIYYDAYKDFDRNEFFDR